jgi:hypothetical protein
MGVHCVERVSVVARKIMSGECQEYSGSLRENKKKEWNEIWTVEKMEADGHAIERRAAMDLER